MISVSTTLQPSNDGLFDPAELQLPGQVPLRLLSWGIDPESDGLSKPGRQIALILLHGLGDGADIWRPVVDCWPQGLPSCPTLAFDLPGHGRSGDLPPGDYSVARVSATINAALGALSINEAILVGHSLGASIALEVSRAGHVRSRATILVELNPDGSRDVERAVADHIDALIEAYCSLEDLVGLIRTRLPLADREVVRHVLLHMARATSDQRRLRLDPEIKQLLGRSTDHDEWRILRSLNCPVAVVRGQYSSVLSKADAERISYATKGPIGHDVIDRAGHAIPLEQPARLAAALERRIARILR